MKRSKLIPILFLFFNFNYAPAQLPLREVDTSFIKKPIIDCATDSLHQHLLATDSVYKRKNDAFETLMLHAKNDATSRASTIYRIPVVVHIMHSGESVGTGTNITDEQVRQGIATLNERFRKTPNGLGDGNGVDVALEFALAVRDESGNCTNGIVRYNMAANTSYVNNGVKFSATTGISDRSLKALSRWSPTKYYNIYIVSKIDASNCSDNSGTYVGGYANFATNHGAVDDGAVLLSCTYLDETSSTFTHELGHAFNLYHTFEGDADGTACPSGNGDFCGDTPRHIRFSADSQYDTQFNNCAYAGANSCDVGTTQNHMHNYMNYAYDRCMNEFTNDQKTRIKMATTSLRGSFLEANGNLSLSPPNTASVDFMLSSNVICVGESVKCTDKSTCSPNSFINTAWTNISFLWTFDDNINPPITSTEQNPSIRFTTAGIYKVSLLITNSHGTTLRTKDDYFVVSSHVNQSCIPATGLNEGNFGFLVSNVNFNTIDNSTSNTVNTTYTDFSCSQSTIVHAAETYPLTIKSRAGITGNYPEQVAVYVDWNDDGNYTLSEQLLSDVTPTNSSKTSSANVLIPTSAVRNKVLTLRVYGEANILSDSEINCSSVMYVPDVEDYGIYLLDPYIHPEANFSSYSKRWCNGENIFFTDSSVNSPTAYAWEFEGGTPAVSADQNPVATFKLAGNHQVTLTASNPAGSSTVTKTIYINECGSSIVYPNPTVDVLKVKLAFNLEDITVSLTDLNGKKLFNQQSTENELLHIDMTSFEKGIYILRIVNKNGVEVFKVVKM
jgi:PKD repeat protein